MILDGYSQQYQLVLVRNNLNCSSFVWNGRYDKHFNNYFKNYRQTFNRIFYGNDNRVAYLNHYSKRNSLDNVLNLRTVESVVLFDNTFFTQQFTHFIGSYLCLLCFHFNTDHDNLLNWLQNKYS